MNKYTINTTEGLLTIKLPSSINEVTLGQMIELQENPELTDIGVIGVFSYVPLETLYTALNINDYEALGGNIMLLSKEIAYLKNVDVVPRKIKIDGKNIKIGSRLTISPLGALLTTRDIIADEINRHIVIFGEDNWMPNFNPSLRACQNIMAEYLYFKVTGQPYATDCVVAFRDKVKYLPINVVLPITKALILNYPEFKDPKISFLTRCKNLFNQTLAVKRFNKIKR